MTTITTKYLGDMLFDTRLGRHTLITDVPEEMGGKDRGPAPPQLFIASLGACVGALVAQYCERKGTDTRDMTVEVAFEKLSHPARLADIHVTVRLPHADVSSGRCRDALVKVAEHCPVHATIETVKGIRFDIVGLGFRDSAGSLRGETAA